jgi:hypothetical protein
MKTRKQKRSERQSAKAGKTGVPYAVKQGVFNGERVGRNEAIKLYEESQVRS